MTSYRLILTRNALKDLGSLQKETAGRIVDKLEYFGASVNPLIYAKKLTGSSIGQYRFRIGDYRAIFDIDRFGRIQILMILRIKHRKDIYGL